MPKHTPLLALLLLALPSPASARPGRTAEHADFESRLIDLLGPARAATQHPDGGRGSHVWTDGAASGRLGERRMRKANEAAAEILALKEPEELSALREEGRASVVVVTGQYDRVQDVLAAGALR